MRKFVSLLGGAVLLAAVPASAVPRLSSEAKLARALEGRVAGEAVNCINLQRATSSQVIEKEAIVYRAGGTLYVNRPRAGADSLGGWDVLLTRTFSSQLCSGDVVELVDPSTGHMNGLVFLGEFVPYKRAR
jgi:hypothetical protein